MDDKTTEEKLGLLKQLVLIANADGKIKEIEYQLLLGLAANLGITKEDFDHIFEPSVQVVMPKELGDRIIQFHRMILLMNVDMDASPVEMDMMRKMGIMLGLNAQAIELVLSEMKMHPNNLIPPDRMVQIFTKYLN